jgi:hypothetical protein
VIFAVLAKFAVTLEALNALRLVIVTGVSELPLPVQHCTMSPLVLVRLRDERFRANDVTAVEDVAEAFAAPAATVPEPDPPIRPPTL